MVVEFDHGGGIQSLVQLDDKDAKGDVVEEEGKYLMGLPAAVRQPVPTQLVKQPADFNRLSVFFGIFLMKALVHLLFQLTHELGKRAYRYQRRLRGGSKRTGHLPGCVSKD